MTTMRTDAVYLDAYDAVRARIAGLVGQGDGDAPVPGCRGGRVKDVLAHLAGLCGAWVNHRLDGYASAPWTAAQVARFADHSCGEILDRWADSMAAFAALGDQPVMGRPPARWAFGDAVIHEGDIRGALAAGRVPNDAVLLALNGTLERWQQVLSTAGTPALHLQQSGAHDWWLGTAHSPDAVSCQAETYEIFRALAGRRTAQQVRSWGWSADPDPFIRVGLAVPFRWAEDPISD